MAVIAVVNTKGGAGKSTVATNLAARFAGDSRSVKLMDTDAIQHSADDWLETRASLGVGDIRGTPVVPEIARQLARGKTYATIRAEASLWSWLVVDCPGNDSPETRGAMGAADFIVMPVGMGQFDINAAGQMGALIERAKESGPLAPVLAVLNNVDPKCTREAQDVMDYLFSQHGVFMLHPEVLWTRQAVRTAIRDGLGVHELKGGAHDIKATAEFESLYKGVRDGIKS